MKKIDGIHQKIRVLQKVLAKPENKRRFTLGTIVLIVLAIIFSSIISIFPIKNAQATPTYKFKTGKYVGSGGGRAISGLGFAPELVILKATTTAGVGAFMQTTAMADNTVSYLASATADDTTGLISLGSDGFSVSGTNSNAANVNWTWMAFAGSNCTSGGTFCVGTYTGAGSGTKAITTGFQPDMVLVKAATALAPNWRSSAMPTNYAQFLMATVQDTTGAYFTTLDATGFTVGASNNTAVAFHYIAFKNVAGSVNVGTYTGNGTSQSISGIGFQPDAVILKNANAGTAVGAVYNVDQSYGNSSSYFTDTANVVGSITSIDATGFSVGADSTANGSTNTIYWAAFAGSSAPTSSGTFKMATGTYTGNGAYQNFSGLGFAPDLVIIKGNTTSAGVFRTSLHSGDLTSYLDAATADFALGIQSLNPDGFSIGTSATVNTNAIAYYWTAYGNAWRPGTNSGASDFMIGSYYGNGVDNRNITNMPWQPDFVTVKAATAVAGTFRTSAQSGDLSSFFAAAAEAANNIQALNADGFQVGTSTSVNTAAVQYWYFAFKNGTNFTVNTYSGNGSTQNITTAGFQPDNLWVKATGATRGVEKTSSEAAANCAPFINVAEIATAFSGFISTGFGLTNAAETNSSGSSNYRYVAWRKTNTVATPTYKFKTGKYVGSGGGRAISGLGFAPELVILKATTTAGVGAFMQTTAMADNTVSYLASATADDTTGLISLGSDGFSVSGTNSNAANVNWTWMAFAGSNCTSGGTFCVGTYTGAGSGTKAITTGFQPDMVLVKAATALAPNWRSSAMPTNYAQFLMATVQDTTGAYFTTLDATGFTVGASNNTAVAFHYIAFKNVAGSVNVGTYTGNGTSQSISGIGFQPDAVILKNANAGTAVGAVYNVDQSYGNSSSYFTDTANVVGSITSIDATGFSVGADSTANGSTNTIYWAAFAGSSAPTSSGTFKMATGTYTGNGAYQNFSGLGFAPDLVIIKGNTTSAGVFRTSLHSGDLTSYLDAATADFALGIQSLNPDGFSIGTSATVNTNAIAYYWTAYGNAWRPGTNSGASDFMIGSYYGNGVDNRNITNMPWQPDFVTVKAATAVAGTFRTSAQSGDLSSFFAAAAEAANNIQALNADGFQVGTSTSVNTAAVQYWYFAFKNGTNFTVNTYSGNGSTQNITTAGFQPDNLWVKATGATRGVEKTSSEAAANCAPFINVAEIATAFSGFISTGFGLTNAAETNSSGSSNYRYVAWKVPGSANNPPNSPATLTQKTSPGGVSITESAWTTDNTPDLGFTITDPDAGDTVKYEVQLATDSGFSSLVLDYTHGSLSASGTTFAFTVGSYGGGSCTGTCPATLSDSSTGYWWRVKGIDNSGASSSYVEFGVAGTMDLKVDVTAPTGGSVTDGANTGSLSQLAATWSGFSDPTSGIAKYEYAIGTTAGGTDIKTWTDNSTNTNVTSTGLNLQTSVKYYFTVRATDNVTNVGTPANSSGQFVSPALSFSIDNNTVTFSNLNAGNSWTDTKTTVVHTVTNAANGYSVRAYSSGLLTSIVNPAINIPNYTSPYSAPTTWSGTGFGYTVNDPDINSIDKWTSATKFCAFGTSLPGDVIADHETAVNGTSGNADDTYTLTYKVVAPTAQSASTYQTTVTYIAVPNF